MVTLFMNLINRSLLFKSYLYNVFISISPEIFALFSKSLLSLRAVWFLTIGMGFFNCSGDRFTPLLTGNDWTTFDMLPEKYSKWQGVTIFFTCWITFINPVSAFVTTSACSRKDGCSFWIIPIINIVPRNTLPTVPFEVTLFTTIKIPDILIFLQASGNYLSYLIITMVMISYIDCISDPFFSKSWSCL